MDLLRRLGGHLLDVHAAGWKFKYELYPSEDTKVIAWVDGIQSELNAFIVENKKGTGYTYVVNTRNPNSLPNRVFTDAVTDFIYYLCAYYVTPLSFTPYPDNEYWLSHGQADEVVYLIHDNSTIPQNLTYYIKPFVAGLIPDKEYVVFDYINNEFHGINKGPMILLNVTLQPNEGKLVLLLEKEDKPQVIYSGAPLTEVSWNSSFEILSLTANGTAGQECLMQVQTGELRPFYFKVNGEEVSAWSFDASTRVMSADFSFPSEIVELIFGFKPIAIDHAFVSDERADVGSIQTVGFHLVWASDGSDLVGASVNVNGTKYFTNETGWISFDTSYNTIGRVVWNVTGVTYNDFTDYVKAVSDPYMIWDRVNVTDAILIEDIIQAGSSQPVWLTAEYEYDSVRFDDSTGTLFLNGESMMWSNQNSRWEINVTSNILGPQGYEVTSVDDRIFSLEAVRNQDREISIIWDEVVVSKLEFETMELGVTDIKVYATFDYTGNPVVNAYVTVNGKPCSEIEPGIYTCESTGWSPFQSFSVEVESPNFEQATKTVLNVHISNTILYVAIGLAIVLPIVFVVLRKRRNRKKRESPSLGMSSNVRLLFSWV